MRETGGGDLVAAGSGGGSGDDDLERRVSTMSIESKTNGGIAGNSLDLVGEMVELYVNIDCSFEEKKGAVLSAFDQLDCVLMGPRSVKIREALPEAEREKFGDVCRKWDDEKRGFQGTGRGFMSPCPRRNGPKPSEDDEKNNERIIKRNFAFVSGYFAGVSQRLSVDEPIATSMANRFADVNASAMGILLLKDKYAIQVPSVGKGEFGIVYKATYEDSAGAVIPVAVKHFLLGPNQTIDHVKDEIEMMSYITSPMFPQILASSINLYSPYVVMEWLDGGTLDMYINDARKTARDRVAEAPTLLRKLDSALLFMDLKGIVHRDIKVDNVALKKTDDISSAVLFDLGLGRKASGNCETVAGTFKYMAPEVMFCGSRGHNSDYSGKKADIFSLGCLGIEFVVGSNAYNSLERERKKGKFNIKSVKETLSQQSVPEIGIGLLCGMIAPEPNKRPCVVDIFFHEWLNAAPNPFETKEMKNCSWILDVSKSVHSKRRLEEELEEELEELKKKLATETKKLATETERRTIVESQLLCERRAQELATAAAPPVFASSNGSVSQADFQRATIRIVYNGARLELATNGTVTNDVIYLAVTDRLAGVVTV